MVLGQSYTKVCGINEGCELNLGSNDICTINIKQPFVTTTYPLFSLDENNTERKKKKENKNTYEYEREGCSKSC